MRVSPFLCGIGIGICLPVATLAQAPAADAASPVPRVLYRSVFADTPKGVETDALDWKSANAEVGQLTRGHVDILKWEAAQPKGQTVLPAVPASSGSGVESRKP